MSGGQLTRADLEQLTPEEVAEAYRQGRLNTALGGREPLPTTGQLTRADLEGRSPEEITAARERGQLDQLLGRSQRG